MTRASSTHLTVRPRILYVGTPVMLIGSQNPDGSANLAPASSYWALGQMLVIGLENDGQTIQNVHAHPELTVNFPQPALWPAVEAIADTTARTPVPEAKRERYTHVADKFAASALTAQPSEAVSPPRVAECALQLEAVVRRAIPGLGEYHLVEAEVVRVHAAREIVVPGTDHIDPRAWRPMIYSFRHYFDLGEEHGFRPSSDVAGAGADPA